MRQREALAQAEFIDVAGVRWRLADLIRPLSLVNLWAAWCAGCVVELPTLHALVNQLGSSNIDVVLLSHAMNWQGDLAYARANALPFRLWRLAPTASERVVATAFRIEQDRFALPQSLVLAGRTRTLVSYAEGSRDWASRDQLVAARRWLAEAG